MVEDDGMEVVVALLVLQLWEGGGTPIMVDDDGMEAACPEWRRRRGITVVVAHTRLK